MTATGVRDGRAGSAFPDPPPTDEVEWARIVARAPELPISARPVVVVAPHPDDESLAVGGVLVELAAHDVEVEVVAVTDGEASHPDLGNLGTLRTEEQRRALAALGIESPPARLGLPDGQVSHHGPALIDALTERSGPETLLIAPWAHDGHPDHDACGVAAVEVARRTGCGLWAYPLWAWRWASPSDLAPLSLRRVTLSAKAQEAKAKAIACHQTQTTHLDGPPILADDVLAHFRRPWDVIIDGRDLIGD
ncbi:MAG: PIG-L deacetylase family protein [Iamia sp.]